jgi:hypothetical protein
MPDIEGELFVVETGLDDRLTGCVAAIASDDVTQRSSWAAQAW